MSAVPKKKLCWNCEGNIIKDVDNCPYCGVYVHSPELDEINNWNVPYVVENKKEEIPSPLYQLHSTEEVQDNVNEELNESHSESASMFQQLKNDVLPTLLLMVGSIFFLFGLILFLFSNQGTLTLQWNGNHWPYFLFFSLPSVYFGWKFLLQVDRNEDEEQVK